MFAQKAKKRLSKSPLTSLSNDLYSVLDNQEALKTLSRPLLTFKVDENSRTFQGKMEFKDFSRTPPTIQGLFKTVQTLSSVHLKKTLHRNLI